VRFSGDQKYGSRMVLNLGCGKNEVLINLPVWPKIFEFVVLTSLISVCTYRSEVT